MECDRRCGRHARGAHAAPSRVPASRWMSSAPAARTPAIVEVRQRLRVARRARPRHPIRRERLERHDPRRHRGGEVLGEERPQRLVLPGLHVARRPVIQQAQPEDVALGLAPAARDCRARCPRRRTPPARARSRAAASAAAPGAARPAGMSWPRGRRDALARDADRGRAAVIGDRHPLVVRQQRIVGAEQPPDRGGVMDGGVEVGVVADVGGDAVLGRGLRHEQRAQRCGLRPRPRAAPATAPRAARSRPPRPRP